MLARKKIKAVVLIFERLQGTTVETVGAFNGRVSHNYGSRGSKATLRITRVRTKAKIKSFWSLGPSCFNKLPVTIQSLLIYDSIVLFKRQLRNTCKDLHCVSKLGL